MARTRIETRVESWTKQKAERQLKSNPRNRNINKSRVQTYAKWMREGRWEMTGEAVIIDEDGDLADGQHRLAAIVESGISQKINTVRGVSKDAVRQIDTGQTRTPGNILKILHPEVKDPNATAAALKLLHRCKARELYIDGAGPKLPMAELEMLYEKNTGINDAVRLSGKLRKVPMSSSGAAFAYYLTMLRDPEMAEEFASKVATGEMLRADDPALAVRNTLIDARVKDMRLRAQEQAWIYITGWNLYRQKRRRKMRFKIKLDSKNKFPKAV